jgi:uncharacterized paraquat-inducible protein A
VKTVIRHLPQNTPAEDSPNGLVGLRFDVISVTLMTATRRSPSERSKTINLPLFLITLPRTAISQEIFRLQSLCHIAIRMEAYRAQNDLTQCHNCQQFGHVWENCKQHPRCLRCGGGHLHKECPEKGTHQVAVSCPATMEPRVPAALPQHEQQTTGQPVRAPNVNTLYLEKKC